MIASMAQGKRNILNHEENTMTTRQPPHIRLTQAARMLKVSIATVRRHFDSGKLRGFRTLGNQRRVYLWDVDAAACGCEIDYDQPPRPPDTSDARDTADSAPGPKNAPHDALDLDKELDSLGDDPDLEESEGDDETPWYEM
jgi:excisionase family DNA binding protein